MPPTAPPSAAIATAEFASARFRALGGTCIEAVAWLHGDKEIVVAGSTGMLILEASSLVERLTINTDEPVAAVATSLAGELIASANSEMPSVNIWNALDGRLLFTLEPQPLVEGFTARGVEGGMAFIADSPVLAVASDAIHFWDLDRGGLIQTIDEKTMWIDAIAASSDGRILATAGGYQDATIRLRDATTGVLIRVLASGDYIETLSLAEDASLLVSGNRSGHVELWDVSSGRLLAFLQERNPTTAVDMAPDGESIASASWMWPTVTIWDRTLAHEVAQFRHDAGIRQVSFSPSGALLASVSYDGSARIWDVSQRELMSVIQGDECDIFDRD